MSLYKSVHKEFNPKDYGLYLYQKTILNGNYEYKYDSNGNLLKKSKSFSDRGAQYFYAIDNLDIDLMIAFDIYHFYFDKVTIFYKDKKNTQSVATLDQLHAFIKEMGFDRAIVRTARIENIFSLFEIQ